jgi:hypothetical protein
LGDALRKEIILQVKWVKVWENAEKRVAEMAKESVYGVICHSNLLF